MTELEQKLTGENKVLRDLLSEANEAMRDVIDDCARDGAIEHMVRQIDAALQCSPVDLLG